MTGSGSTGLGDLQRQLEVIAKRVTANQDTASSAATTAGATAARITAAEAAIEALKRSQLGTAELVAANRARIETLERALDAGTVTPPTPARWREAFLAGTFGFPALPAFDPGVEVWGRCHIGAGGSVDEDGTSMEHPTTWRGAFEYWKGKGFRPGLMFCLDPRAPIRNLLADTRDRTDIRDADLPTDLTYERFDWEGTPAPIITTLPEAVDEHGWAEVDVRGIPYHYQLRDGRPRQGRDPAGLAFQVPGIRAGLFALIGAPGHGLALGRHWGEVVPVNGVDLLGVDLSFHECHGLSFRPSDRLLGRNVRLRFVMGVANRDHWIADQQGETADLFSFSGVTGGLAQNIVSLHMEDDGVEGHGGADNIFEDVVAIGCGFRDESRTLENWLDPDRVWRLGERPEKYTGNGNGIKAHKGATVRRWLTAYNYAAGVTHNGGPDVTIEDGTSVRDGIGIVARSERNIVRRCITVEPAKPDLLDGPGIVLEDNAFARPASAVRSVKLGDPLLGVPLEPLAGVGWARSA